MFGTVGGLRGIVTCCLPGVYPTWQPHTASLKLKAELPTSVGQVGLCLPVVPFPSVG